MAFLAEHDKMGRDLHMTLQEHNRVVREVAKTHQTNCNKLIQQISNWKIATTITFLAGLALGMLAMHQILTGG